MRGHSLFRQAPVSVHIIKVSLHTTSQLKNEVEVKKVTTLHSESEMTLALVFELTRHGAVSVGSLHMQVHKYIMRHGHTCTNVCHVCVCSCAVYTFV